MPWVLFREYSYESGGGEAERVAEFTCPKEGLASLEAAAGAEWPKLPLEKLERIGSLNGPAGLRLAPPKEAEPADEDGEAPIRISFHLTLEEEEEV